MKTSKYIFSLLVVLSLLTVPALASAALTDTLPQNMFLLDISYNHSWLSKRWDDNNGTASLIEEIERFEPGGGMQGILTPNAKVQYSVMIMMLNYGILDDLNVGLGIPLILKSSVNPDFDWEVGDFQPSLGRPYSQDDFWEWAASMGQPRPGNWTGNKGTLGDMIMGVRYKWTHRIDPIREANWSSTLTIMGAFPTGSQKDPEEITSAGTTMWDLHSQGDLSFHLAVDKRFKDELDDRLTVGLDFFYELFFEHTYDTPRGIVNPLLLNNAIYVGDTYKLDPGDFSGVALQFDVTAYKGPRKDTWITKGDQKKIDAMPPIITIMLQYNFTYLQQSEWSSDSDLWDYNQEDDWKPGFKNILTAKLGFSFIRLGAPLQLYIKYRTLSLIPGKNTRSADVLTGGVQLPFAIW